MRRTFYSSLGITAATACGVLVTALMACGGDEGSTSTTAASSSSGSGSSTSGTMAGAGGAAGMGGAGGTSSAGGAGGTGQGGSGGSAMAMAMPNFKLLDTNQNSLTYQQQLEVNQTLGKVSAWYFGHST